MLIGTLEALPTWIRCGGYTSLLYANLVVEGIEGCEGLPSCSTKLHSSTRMEPYLLPAVLRLMSVSSNEGGVILNPPGGGTIVAEVSWLRINVKAKRLNDSD